MVFSLAEKAGQWQALLPNVCVRRSGGSTVGLMLIDLVARTTRCVVSIVIKLGWCTV